MADTATLIEEPGTDVAVQKEHAPAVQYDMENLTFAERIILDPSIDMDRVDRAIEMQRASEAYSAEKAFNVALAEMQPNLPAVSANGEGHNNIKYGRLEDIQGAIRPILQEYGFAVRFKVHESDAGLAVECILSHREGHSDSDTIPLPLDTTGSKNDVQARGSTVSYGKRYTLCNILNIQVGGLDNDGGAPLSGNTLTPEQANFITDTLKALGTSEEAFLEWCATKGYGATEVALLPTERFSVVEKQLNYWLANRPKKGGDDATG